MVQADCNAKYR